MTLPRETLRLLVASVVALPLAAISGAHALSSASLRLAPELAISVFPFNGLAAEKLAYATFANRVKDALTGNAGQAADTPGGAQARPRQEFDGGASGLQAYARSAVPAARAALALEPLLPKAHAILAMSEPDPEQRRQIVALASRLNRRELALQGLVLQQKANEGDYAGTITTLDQILRVHPERQAEFFPLLVDALAQKETKQAFSNLLRDDLPWRDAFLGFAVNEPRTLDNLADIREEISLDNLTFDRRLIVGLVAQGNLEKALAVYNLASGPQQGNSASSWKSDYPPFDWELADTAGLRAQADKSLSNLEFSIEPGNGGVLASRLIPAPGSPFQVRISHEVEPLSQTKDLQFRISCMGQAKPFFGDTFSVGESVFQIRNRPDCPYLTIAIAGRAWTGSSALNGKLGTLKISPK